MNTITEDYLTPVEAADLLRISDRHLRTLTQEGVVPAVRLSARTIRYSRHQLLSFASRPEKRCAAAGMVESVGKNN